MKSKSGLESAILDETQPSELLPNPSFYQGKGSHHTQVLDLLPCAESEPSSSLPPPMRDASRSSSPLACSSPSNPVALAAATSPLPPNPAAASRLSPLSAGAGEETRGLGFDKNYKGRGFSQKHPTAGPAWHSTWAKGAVLAGFGLSMNRKVEFRDPDARFASLGTQAKLRDKFGDLECNLLYLKNRTAFEIFHVYTFEVC